MRDTMRLLLGGGFNGLANLGTFKRWLFGKYKSFSIPVRTVFYLLVAVAVVAALIVLNTTIGLVAAGLPKEDCDKVVKNWSDPDATTLLAAHTEYWEDPLLYETIFRQVTS